MFAIIETTSTPVPGIIIFPAIKSSCCKKKGKKILDHYLRNIEKKGTSEEM